jgi:hypothetical protein
LAEGIGLENRQGLNGSRGFESLFLRHILQTHKIGDIQNRYVYVTIFFIYWIFGQQSNNTTNVFHVERRFLWIR